MQTVHTPIDLRVLQRIIRSSHCVYLLNTMATSPLTGAYYNQCGTKVNGQFLWFREINSRKFLSFQRYRGKVSLHIRVYTIDDQDYCLIPTKKGAMLDKQQTRDLMTAMHELATFIGVVSNLTLNIIHTVHVDMHDTTISYHFAGCTKQHNPLR